MNMAIIGGDRRFELLSKMLESKGNTVCHVGRGNAITEEEISSIEKAEVIILPIPCTADGKRINGGGKPKITEDLIKAMEGKKVFAGMVENLTEEVRGRLDITDYGKREDYLILNAQATAEAAFAISVELSEKALFNSSVLILGFGRIGKTLAALFKASGAKVTVCARRSEHFAQIECLGAEKAAYRELKERAEESDIIINTVPARVVDEKVIETLSKQTVIIDLASGEGGTDFEAAVKHGITAEHALSLPGKYSPVSAAGFIMDTIDAMLEEVKEDERN